MTLEQPAILQIIPSLEEGGAERTTLEITQGLVERGWRAIVATASGRMIEDVRDVGGQVCLMPVAAKNPLTIWQNRAGLAAFCKKESVDLLHARSRAPAWSAYWAAKSLNLPFVTTYHGAYRSGNRLKTLYNSVMVRGDRVIANSAFTKARILASFGDRFPDLPDRLVVIPRGVDLASFVPEMISQPRIDKISRCYAVPKSNGDIAAPLIMMLPARMTAWKGHEVAIEALALIKRSWAEFVPESPVGQIHAGNWPGLRLIFVGGDNSSGTGAALEDDGNAYETRLRSLVVDKGVGDLVTFAGHVDDMPAAYCAADMVLAPSVRPEAFGRVAVESGAMGVPVIATNHGGARETILDQETGILIPPSDARALATAICQLAMMGTADRAQMGKIARQRVASKFSKDAMVEATLAIYENLLKTDTQMSMHARAKRGVH